MELGRLTFASILHTRRPDSSKSRRSRARKHLGVSLFAAASLVLSASSNAAGLIFHDDFESYPTGPLPTATAGGWYKGTMNVPQVVTSSADGAAGPHSGTKMLRSNSNGTLAWNDPARFEECVLNTSNYQNELFIRAWTRIDANHDRSNGSAAKILRIFNWDGVQATYMDLYEVVETSSGLVNQGTAGGTQLATYWGSASGDISASTSRWHKVEYYFNAAQGRVKVWHDGVLVRNDVAPFNGAKWSPFWLTSNWEDSHDAVNYVYFDDVEVYSDVGTGATGLMSDATITAFGTSTARLPAPTNLRVNSVTQ